MFKRFSKYLLFVFIFSATITYGQEDFEHSNKLFNFDKSKIYFGGNLGNFMFGSVTSIDISPIVGYRFTEKFSLGLGISYQYFNSISYNINTSIYGGRILGDYIINEYIILHSEFEELSYETKYYDITNQYFNQSRFWVPALYVGGGLKQQLGEHSYAYVMVLFNILDSSLPHVSNPILRIGFSF